MASKGRIKRMSLAQGIPYVSKNAAAHLQVWLSRYIQDVTRDAATITDSSSRQKITEADVLYALEVNGTPVYNC